MMSVMVNSIVKDARRNLLLLQQIDQCCCEHRNVIVLSDRIVQLQELHERLQCKGHDVSILIASTPTRNAPKD